MDNLSETVSDCKSYIRDNLNNAEDTLDKVVKIHKHLKIREVCNLANKNNSNPEDKTELSSDLNKLSDIIKETVVPDIAEIKKNMGNPKRRKMKVSLSSASASASGSSSSEESNVGIDMTLKNLTNNIKVIHDKINTMDSIQIKSNDVTNSDVLTTFNENFEKLETQVQNLWCKVDVVDNKCTHFTSQMEESDQNLHKKLMHLEEFAKTSQSPTTGNVGSVHSGRFGSNF